ncbi:hypothetical protein N6H14_03480 [Paenibacillus sp. CC-CFT747]|nr:hypothetical protein N6H14_03480 [Paenibacillus sp. CC-CFT747]
MLLAAKWYYHSLRYLWRRHIEACPHGTYQKKGLDVRWLGWDSEASSYLSYYKYSFASGYLSILEALAAGVFVISTYDNELKHDYLSLWKDVSGLISIAESKEDIIKELIIYNSFTPGQTKEYKDLAREIIGKYSWENLAKIHETLYTMKKR